MKRIILSIAVLVSLSCASDKYKTDMFFNEWERIENDRSVYEMDDREICMNIIANAGFSLDQQEIVYNKLDAYYDVLTERDIIAFLEAFNGDVNKTFNYIANYNGEETDWAW